MKAKIGSEIKSAEVETTANGIVGVKELDTKPKTEESDEALLKKVGERLQFFFSNSNLRTDRYMKNQMLSRSDKTIEISNLLRFKTIKVLTSSPETIAKAAETQLADLVCLNEAHDAIGRKDDFDFNSPIEKIHALTLFVEGIPLDDEDRYTVIVPDICALFQTFGKVMLVRLRYDKKNRKALGSAFVEFDTKENLKKVLDHDQTLELKGNQLKVKSMDAWIQDKENARGKFSTHNNLDSNAKKRPRDENDNDNENDKNHNDVETADEEASEFKIEWEKGCVISLKGLPSGCDREAIMDAIKDTCESKEMDSCPYIDYSRGQTDGAIRFKKPSEKFKDVVSKLKDGEIQICGKKVEGAFLLEGEEEEKYWKAYEQFKRSQTKQFAMRKRNKNKRGGHGRGGYGRGGYGRGGSRR